MLFNSIDFLLFFPLVVILYFSLPHKHRWILLLAASYFFYMCWKVEYVILILISTLIDYLAGIKMAKLPTKALRKKYLILSLIGNLGMLIGFKYFNFLSENVSHVFGWFNVFYHAPELKILLPVGISFYTFQTLSYTIDIYKGISKAETHFGRFALFVSFFPQLVAGPIERSRNLLPQMREKHEFDFNLFTSGLKLMAWGFFKKVVIADRLSIYVADIYANPHAHFGAEVWLASVFFAFQLYCDFSAYSDIAIGSARVMGFRLMKNFDRPFISRTFSEFWNRWHISLNTWFRDYFLFALPIGKNKKWIKFRIHVNLTITVIIIGLWHGANWTFVLWGSLMAFYMLFESLTRKYRNVLVHFIHLDKLPKLLAYIQMSLIFLFVSISPVLFRANSVSDILILAQNALNQSTFLDSFAILKQDYVVFDLLLVFSLLLLEFLQDKYRLSAWIAGKPIILRWSVYLGFIFIILVLGIFNEQEFYYFQF